MKRYCLNSSSGPVEFRIVAFRECPIVQDFTYCEKPEQAVRYWREHIEHAPYFNPECECAVALILNTRMRIKGHQMISIGSMTTLLVHAREVFRGAIVASAYGIVLMHNHPSGDPKPSDADIHITRELVRAGKLLKLELLDHIVIGRDTHISLREQGYLYA